MNFGLIVILEKEIGDFLWVVDIVKGNRFLKVDVLEKRDVILKVN